MFGCYVTPKYLSLRDPFKTEYSQTTAHWPYVPGREPVQYKDSQVGAGLPDHFTPLRPLDMPKAVPSRVRSTGLGPNAHPPEGRHGATAVDFPVVSLQYAEWRDECARLACSAWRGSLFSTSTSGNRALL